VLLSKHLYKYDWESAYIKRHLYIDLMTISCPPTFYNKIAPMRRTTNAEVFGASCCQ